MSFLSHFLSFILEALCVCVQLAYKDIQFGSEKGFFWAKELPFSKPHTVEKSSIGKENHRGHSADLGP